MKPPYLIQRCKLQWNIGEITGFDSVFRCDYMGSSEFEFGALPASLRRIVAHNWEIYESGYKANDGRGLFIVACATGQKDQILPYIPQLIERKIRTKETTRLKESMTGDGYAKDIVLWWDIESDWFLCLGKDVAKLLIKAIDALRAKWSTKKKG